MWNQSVVTDAGNALLIRAAAGETLEITGAKAGTGTVAEAELRSQTALREEKQTLSIVLTDKVEKGNRYKIQFQPVEGAEGYTANQVGLYARMGEEGEVLLALYQDPSGVAIPTQEELRDFVYTLYAVIAIDNSGKLSVAIDSSAYLTMETLQQVEAQLNGIVSEAEEGMQAILDRAALPVYEVTIPTEGWGEDESGLQQVTVEAEGVKSTDTPVADVNLSGSAEEQLAILRAFALITSINTGEGSITVHATAAPEVAIPLNLKEMR